MRAPLTKHSVRQPAPVGPEQQVVRAIEAAGGEVGGPDVFRLRGEPDVFVVIDRTTEGVFSGVRFELPLRAQRDAPGAVPWLPPLSLVGENPAHRSDKARGASRELQTGDRDFDDRVYVDSAARDAEVAAVLGIPAVRRAVVDTLGLGVLRVELHNGRRPRLVIDPGRIVEPASIRAVAEHARAMATALPSFRSTGWRPRLGPGGLLTYVTALAVIPGLLVATAGSDHWEVISSDLALHAAFASIVPYGLLVAMARARARRSSRGASRLWGIVVAGAIAVPTWTIGLAHGANAELDASVSVRTVWDGDRTA